VEQSLVEHVCRGEWLDLAKGQVIDEAAMRSWGEHRTCRATVIRDILRGRLAPDPDPYGLRLRGARISGRLDLENLSTKVNFELTDCLLEEGVIAREARMASVRLRGCRIKHPAKPPLDAAGLVCNLLDLSGATIIGHDEAEDGGAVRLLGARIDGHLDCTGASLSNDKGPALTADGLEVRLGMFLRGGFTATGARKRGAVLLRGARIGRHLVCSGASLCNDTGPALVANGLRVTQDVYLDEEFTAAGTVNLTSADISGQLSCRGAQLNGADENGNALLGERMKVGGDVLLDENSLRKEKFSTAAGAVCLLGADISGQLSCRGARLNGRDENGNALYGERMRVGGDVLLQEQFTANSAVDLVGAHIGGNLDCTGARLRNDSGPALSAESLQVGQGILLRSRFRAISVGANEAVNLKGAQVAGALVFDPGLLEHVPDRCRRLTVDGLTYTGVPETGSGWDWLDLLRHATPSYAAQPYQRLAAGYRALGDERQVREILMAQRDDQLARTQPRPRWTERLWGRITKCTLGYGYQPWRALIFLAAVLMLSCVLAVVLGWHGALAQAKDTAAAGKPCTVMQRVSVGLDLNLPVGASLARAGCGLPKNAASVTAAWLTGVGWVLRVLAWTFAALFIAGFTSAVRKT